MPRDHGRFDSRIPRGWERATRSPKSYRTNHDRTFGRREELSGFCNKCQRTHSWCECSLAGNVCKE